MIKPDAYMQIGKIINILEEAHFTITNFKLARLTKADAETFYAELKGTPYFNQKVDFLISDVVAAFEVVSQDCINKLKDIVGNADPQKARAEHPKSIRAQFGEDSIKNAVHSSESASSAVKEI